MKAYRKSVIRMFRKNISRFLSVVLIVMIGIGLTSGIGAVTGKIKTSASTFADERNIADITLKSTSDTGFTAEQIQKLRERYGAENVAVGASFDVMLTVNGERRLTRLYLSDDITVRTVNRLSDEDRATADAVANEGTFPVYAEKADKHLRGYAVGDRITLDCEDIYLQLAEQNGTEIAEETRRMLSLLPKVSLTVVKNIEDPRFFSEDGEPSYLNREDTDLTESAGTSSLITLDDILYLPSAALPFLSAAGEIAVSLPSARGSELFSDSYRTVVGEEQARILSLLTDAGADEEDIRTLTLSDNYSFYSLNSYAEKITGLSVLLMVAFMFITVLVVLSDMTRLIEEERSQTACLVSLGYSSGRILSKYELFFLTATVIGGIAAYFVGIGLSSFIYLVFDYSYVMPPETSVFTTTVFFVTFLFMIVSVLVTTLIVGRKTAKESPAALMMPKAPKPGKKVLPEKIPALWNRLSFKYKSSLRNVLRYGGRFLMTVSAVAGSMGLVLAGLSLLDLCLFGDFGNGAIAGLAVVIVAFAALLTLTAIYTMTAISVSERTREIATLMVLGYDDGEVCGYIYREIYIDTAVGVLFGYGVGAFLIWMVFRVMGFGSVGAVPFYVWLTAPVLIFLFTSLVTLLLRRRIVSVDMNASLKALE